MNLLAAVPAQLSPQNCGFINGNVSSPSSYQEKFATASSNGRKFSGETSFSSQGNAMQLYHCNDCSYKTPSLRKLGRHNSVNHAGVKYRCEMCDFVTGYQSNYYRHRKQVHSLMSPNANGTSPKKALMSQKTDRCSSFPTNNLTPVNYLPQKLTFSDIQMPHHQLTKSLSDLVPYQRLDLLFLQHGSLLICPTCSIKFGNKVEFENHLMNGDCFSNNMQINQTSSNCEEPAEDGSHEAVHRCSHCDYYSEKSRDYLHHLKYVHLQNFDIFYCSQCYFASKEQIELYHHCKSLHTDHSDTTQSESGHQEARVYSRNIENCQCNYCDYAGMSISNLDDHLAYHYKTAKYCCRRCTFSHDDIQIVASHWRLDHVIFKDDKECQTATNLNNCDTFILDNDVQVGFESFELEKHALSCFAEMELETDDRASSTHTDRGLVVVDCSSSTYQSSPLSSLSIGNSASLSPSSVRPDLSNNKRPSSRLQMTGKKNIIEESTSRSEISYVKRQPKKYLREQEAIVLPSEQFIYEENNDPDVKSLRCSICGYEAHWGSEMVRHKRVHTDQRPYKCKYCDRTSKWKADLIRHISKVHGFRVLSKCSRSFPMDEETAELSTTPEAGDHTATTTDRSSSHSYCDSDQASSKETANVAKARTPELVNGRWSVDAPDDLSKGKSLDRIDQQPNGETTDVQPVDDNHSQNLQSDWSIFEELQRQSLAYQQFFLAAALASSEPVAGNILAKSSTIGQFGANGLPPTTGQSSSAPQNSNKQQWLAEIEKYANVYYSTEGQPILKCCACTYETRDLHTFKAHVQKHENKKPYQCSYCGYRSNWSSDVHKHIRLKKHGHEHAYVVRLNESDLLSLAQTKSAKPTVNICNGRSSIFPRLQSNFAFGAISATKSVENSKENDCKNDEKSANCQAASVEKVGLRRQLVSPFEASPNKLQKRTVDNYISNSKTEQASDLPHSTLLTCKFCPFKSKTLDGSDLDSHLKSHALPKGIMYYKCAFCNYYSKKKPFIFEHMKLHTNEPEIYMAEVDRNLITTSLTVAFSDECATIQDVKESGKFVQHLHSNYKIRNLKENKNEEAIDLSLSKASRKNSTKPTHFIGDISLKGENFSSSDHHEPPEMDDELDTSSNFGADDQDERIENDSVGNLDMTSDCEDSIDPEAYIHAGEEALGNERLLFADMVPKDIQKVSAVIDGQLRKMWQCRYCTHVSKRRANIRMHEKKHFKPNAIGLLKCPQCNYKGDKRSLKVHYRSHAAQVNTMSALERIVCQHCPATFRQKQVYAAHLAFHGGHNRYRCSLCSYAVPSQHQLTQHSLVHRKSGPSKMGTSKKLGALFDRNKAAIDGSLANGEDSQVLTHPQSTMEKFDVLSTNGGTLNNIKPKKRQCRFCPAKFAEKSQIQRHEQFHGVHLKHKCQLCNYSVPFPINLIKHLRAHHNLSINSVAALAPAPKQPIMEQQVPLKTNFHCSKTDGDGAGNSIITDFPTSTDLNGGLNDINICTETVAH